MSARERVVTWQRSPLRECVGAAALLAALLPVRAVAMENGMTPLADQCPALATLPAVECRATELVRSMETAAEIGSLDRTSPTIAHKAHVAITDAAFRCDTPARGAHARAVGALRRAGQLLDRLRRRLVAETRHAKIDPAIEDAYRAVIVPLVADLRIVREQLVCPSNADNVCGDGVPQTGFAGGPGQEECDDGNDRNGDGCSAQCLLEPVREDFSRFHTFTFSRDSAFGFCPPVGELFDAHVTTDPGGVVSLHWSILRDDAGCTEPPFQCADRDAFSRVLTSDEVTQLRDAFRTVRVVDATPNGCATIAFDPCLVNGFTWDEFHANDFLCHAPLLRTDEVTRILGVLTGLAQCADCGDGGTNGAVAYQCLTDGDPGIRGDRMVVEDSNGAFVLSAPFSLQSVTSGLTLTVDLADTELPQNVIVQANFSSLGRPLNLCGVGVSPDGSSTTISVDPDGRVRLDIAQAGLQRAVEVVNTAPFEDCHDVSSVADLALASFYIFRELSPPPDFRTERVTRIDAVAVGIGENVVPTADTPAPICGPP